jgi:hypothetical protein
VHEPRAVDRVGTQHRVEIDGFVGVEHRRSPAAMPAACTAGAVEYLQLSAVWMA